MKQNLTKQSALSLLKSAISILVSHRNLLYPFLLLGFIQLLVLELLYFYPRYPFKIFFGPLVSKLWTEQLMHYPYNLMLLPKLFHYVQGPIYIIIGYFLICTSINAVSKINNGEKVHFKSDFAELFKRSYIHIFVISLLIYIVILSEGKIYQFLYDRAFEIKSISGIYALIKKIIISGEPIFQFVFNVLIISLFMYVYPLITIDKQKVFHAMSTSIYIWRKSFLTTFLIVFIPLLFYMFILLLRNFISVEDTFPEAKVFIIIINIAALLFVDAVIYTAATLNLLLEKENR